MITHDEKRKDTSSMLMKVKRKMKGLLSQVKTFWPKEKFYILILRTAAHTGPQPTVYVSSH